MLIEKLHGLHTTGILLNTRFGIFNPNNNFIREAMSENEEFIDLFSRKAQQNNRLLMQNLTQSGSRSCDDFALPRHARSNSLSNMSVLSAHSNKSGKQLHGQNLKIKRLRHNIWNRHNKPIIIHNHFGNVRCCNEQHKGTFKNKTCGHGGQSHNGKPLLTKEELDRELDEYMSLTKAALDKGLDEYKKRHARIEF